MLITLLSKRCLVYLREQICYCWIRYVSPNEDVSNYGVLAALAVRQLSSCMHNFICRVDAAGALRLEPPVEVRLPSMKVYTYIPVTQSIICRSVAEEMIQADQAAARRKATIGSAKASRPAVPKKTKRSEKPGFDDGQQIPAEDEPASHMLVTPSKDERQGDSRNAASTDKRSRHR